MSKNTFDREPLLPTSFQVSPLNALGPQAKKQPKRTTKTSQKLKLFPEELIQDQIFKEDVKTITEEWPNNLERKYLPRVTAFCTATYDWL
jgi:uncharacterized Rmd1/YagE family protein